jgi:hypothetical protein
MAEIGCKFTKSRVDLKKPTAREATEIEEHGKARLG